MDPEVDPRPGRVREQELLSPELGFSLAAELCCVSRKILQALGFFRHDKYIVRRALGEDAQGPGAALRRDL